MDNLRKRRGIGPATQLPPSSLRYTANQVTFEAPPRDGTSVLARIVKSANEPTTYTKANLLFRLKEPLSAAKWVQPEPATLSHRERAVPHTNTGRSGFP